MIVALSLVSCVLSRLWWVMAVSMVLLSLRIEVAVLRLWT